MHHLLDQVAVVREFRFFGIRRLHSRRGDHDVVDLVKGVVIGGRDLLFSSDLFCGDACGCFRCVSRFGQDRVSGFVKICHRWVSIKIGVGQSGLFVHHVDFSFSRLGLSDFDISDFAFDGFSFNGDSVDGSFVCGLFHHDFSIFSDFDFRFSRLGLSDFNVSDFSFDDFSFDDFGFDGFSFNGDSVDGSFVCGLVHHDFSHFSIYSDFRFSRLGLSDFNVSDFDFDDFNFNGDSVDGSFV